MFADEGIPERSRSILVSEKGGTDIRIVIRQAIRSLRPRRRTPRALLRPSLHGGPDRRERFYLVIVATRVSDEIRQLRFEAFLEPAWRQGERFQCGAFRLIGGVEHVVRITGTADYGGLRAQNTNSLYQSMNRRPVCALNTEYGDTCHNGRNSPPADAIILREEPGLCGIAAGIIGVRLRPTP